VNDSASVAIAGPAEPGPNVHEPEEGARPTVLLPFTHLIRISLYWLGLTAIDSAVGLVIQNRIQFDRTLVPDPYTTGTMLAIVGLGGTILAIMIQLTVGYISDFTLSRWGAGSPTSSSDRCSTWCSCWASRTEHAARAGRLLRPPPGQHQRRPRPFQGYVPDLVAEPQVGRRAPSSA
jgi:hypothetical protein